MANVFEGNAERLLRWLKRPLSNRAKEDMRFDVGDTSAV